MSQTGDATAAVGEPVPAQGGRRVRAGSPGLVPLATMTAMVLVGLDSSAVNVSLPEIGHALGGNTPAVQWILDACTLMFAVLVLSAGSVSDRVGAKRAVAFSLPRQVQRGKIADSGDGRISVG
jgi:MFS transporter, DHA2 family, methylenomycin A resistance protein